MQMGTKIYRKVRLFPNVDKGVRKTVTLEESYLNRDDYIFVVDEKGGTVHIRTYFTYLLLYKRFLLLTTCTWI